MPASARSRNVLPHPGGPYTSTPRGGATPSRANESGYCNGHSTASVSACLTSVMSPTWSNVMPPVCRVSDDDMEIGRTEPTASSRSR